MSLREPPAVGIPWWLVAVVCLLAAALLIASGRDGW